MSRSLDRHRPASDSRTHLPPISSPPVADRRIRSDSSIYRPAMPTVISGDGPLFGRASLREHPCPLSGRVEATALRLGLQVASHSAGDATMERSTLRRWVESLELRPSRRPGAERRRCLPSLVPGGAGRPRGPVRDPGAAQERQRRHRVVLPGSSSPQVGDTIFFAARQRPRLRAVEDQRDGRRYRPGQGHRAGRRRFLPGIPDRTSRDALLRGRRQRPRDANCGRATAPRPAPSWSRTSTRAAPVQCLQPDGHRTDAALHGQRRGQRCGALEERRHRGGHRPGQGHPARQRRLDPAVTTPW